MWASRGWRGGRGSTRRGEQAGNLRVSRHEPLKGHRWNASTSGRKDRRLDGGREGEEAGPPGVHQLEDSGVVELEGGGHMEAHGPPTRVPLGGLVGGHWCTAPPGRYGGAAGRHPPPLPEGG